MRRTRWTLKIAPRWLTIPVAGHGAELKAARRTRAGVFQEAVALHAPRPGTNPRHRLAAQSTPNPASYLDRLNPFAPSLHVANLSPW